MFCVMFVYSRFTKNLPIRFWKTNLSFLRWFCHIELDWHCRTDRPAKRRVGMGDGTKLFVNMCVLFLCAPLQPWAVAPQTKGVILFVGARSTLAFKDPACQ
jgi:hypothetical protein